MEVDERMKPDVQRAKAIRQYIVLHLKTIEFLHLVLINTHLTDAGVVPENVMGHRLDHFRETLLGVAVTYFMALNDRPDRSTNARSIWKMLHPQHANAIDRIWERYIAPGEGVMKGYRDQAGAHGDSVTNFFKAKVGFLQEHAKTLLAMQVFVGLSNRLGKRITKEVPDLAMEIEKVLLEVELALPGGFNRAWLEDYLLVERT